MLHPPYGKKCRLSRFASNLGRLAAGLEAHRWVTRSICRRFLRAYAAEFPPGTIAWKWFWRRIADEAGRIVRRKRRRGKRPVAQIPIGAAVRNDSISIPVWRKMQFRPADFAS